MICIFESQIDWIIGSIGEVPLALILSSQEEKKLFFARAKPNPTFPAWTLPENLC